MDEVMVSIACLTYNHADFIEDAIKGFLAQKTNFSYEIVFHDDASTDGTSDIIRAYQNKYPDLIKCIYQDENQFSKLGCKVVETLYSQCRGQYIAICEGDDYWIDENKLQKQIDFMQKNKNCAMTVHGAMKYNCINGEKTKLNPYKESRYVSAEEIIMQYNGNVPTASIIVRKKITDLPLFYLESGVGDWPLQLNAILQGDVFYFNEYMSVYRAQINDSWSVKVERNKEKYFVHCLKMIRFLLKYDTYTMHKFSVYIISRINSYVYNIVNIYKWSDEKQFIEMCDGLKDANESTGIISEIQRIYKQTYDLNICSSDIKEFISKHNLVYIMGAGKYAEIIAKQLHNNAIDFEGFVVTQKENNKDKYMSKNVLNIRDIEFDNNCGLIVGINPAIWNQIVNTLNDNHINNYICPFLFTGKD